MMNRATRTWLALLTHAGLIAVASAEPPFGPLSSHTVIDPTAIVVGDFNGDGFADRAVVSLEQGTSVAMGDGAGRFFETERLPIVGVQALLRDLTGDTTPDLIVLDAEHCAAVIATNPGDGRFDPPRLVSLPCGVAGLALGDATGDGVDDLLAASTPAQVIMILAGDGAGGFTDAGVVPASLGSGASLFALLDMDGDGARDLITSGADASVIFGDGAGGFTERVPIGDGANLTRVAALDADSNGLPDAVAFVEATQRLVAFKQFTPRSFLPSQALAGATRVSRLVTADADGDGTTDLISLHNGTQAPGGADLTEGSLIPFRGGEIRVFLAGDGLLDESTRLFGGGWPQDLRVADADADGVPDLIAVARPFTETAFFILGEPGATTPGDGVVQVAPGLGGGRFAGAHRLPSARASGIVLDDLDRDGDLDLLESQAFGVLVRRNSGAGAFDLAGGITSEGLPARDQPFALGDATGDGAPDLLLGSSIGLRLAPGRGNGLFDLVRTVSPLVPTAVATGDFVGDHASLVVLGTSEEFTGHARLLRRMTPTLFEPVSSLIIPREPRGVAVADYTGDGVADAAFACREGRALAVVSFVPTAGTPPVTIIPLAGLGLAITAADVDLDGDPDLLAAEDGEASAVLVLLNDGAGRFSEVARLAVGSARALCACDVTLDARPDLLVADSPSDRVLVFEGDAAGGFVEVASVFVGDLPRSIACGDLNGDRRPDIVVSANNENPADITSRTFSAMTVHFNRLVPAGDLDGDRAINAGDLASVLSAWGVCEPGPCPQDLTGDGVVNGADLAVVFSNYGL